MTLQELEIYLKTIDSRYRAVIIAAKRAKQLQKNLRPLFEGKTVKVTTMALDELVNNKVDYIIEESPEVAATAEPSAPSSPEA